MVMNMDTNNAIVSAGELRVSEENGTADIKINNKKYNYS